MQNGIRNWNAKEIYCSNSNVHTISNFVHLISLSQHLTGKHFNKVLTPNSDLALCVCILLFTIIIIVFYVQRQRKSYHSDFVYPTEKMRSSIARSWSRILKSESAVGFRPGSRTSSSAWNTGHRGSSKTWNPESRSFNQL